MSSKPIALVTGASSGIGRTSAIALILAGWRVVLSGRRKEELEATAEMARDALRQEGKEQEANEDGLVLVCVGDVAKEGNVKEMFDQVDKVYGQSLGRGCGRDARMQARVKRQGRASTTAGSYGVPGRDPTSSPVMCRPLSSAARVLHTLHHTNLPSSSRPSRPPLQRKPLFESSYPAR